jgi:hypothetical protein
VSEIDEFGDEETLAEMAERYGRRAVVAEAENARLRGALEQLVGSVVTTMAVFDDGEEEEMLVVPPGPVDAARAAIAALDEEGT